jgi:hypothetical protein
MQRLVVLVRAHEGEGEMIKDVLKRAQISGVPALRIDPSVDITSRPKCFVAMRTARRLTRSARLSWTATVSTRTYSCLRSSTPSCITGVPMRRSTPGSSSNP